MYDSNNIDLIYLSPYVEINKKNQSIIFYNYIFNTILKVERFEDIINDLNKGIEFKKLKEKLEERFGSSEAELLINKLIINGVIE